MKNILLIIFTLATIAVFAQDEVMVLEDLPKNKDKTKIRFVHKTDHDGAAKDHFERATCLFKKTTLLMRNHGAYGAMFNDTTNIIRIKVKEKLVLDHGTKEVFFDFGFKALDDGYALKVENIRFIPRSIEIEWLDHEEANERGKARSAVNKSKNPEIMKEYLDELTKVIEKRFENFDFQFKKSKECRRALTDDDDW